MHLLAAACEAIAATTKKRGKLRLRRDKSAAEIDTLERVRQIYECQKLAPRPPG